MSDLSPEDIEVFRNAVRRFESAASELAGSVGRRSGTDRPSSASGGTRSTSKGNPAADAADRLAKKMNEASKASEKLGDSSEKLEDSTKDLKDGQQDLRKAQSKYKDEMGSLGKGLKNFGKSIFTGNGSLGDAFSSLSNSVYKPSTTFGKSLSGMAFGVGAALGALDTFAKEAADMGAFADLGAISVGSVRQAKLISGLGDSFIKAVAESNGGFRQFGATTNEAIDAFSEMSRAARTGFINPFTKFGKSLDSTTKKQFNNIANASASMGLSAEDTAMVMGSLSSQIRLMDKTGTDSNKLFVKGMKETYDAARTLSTTFGVSAKDMLKVMNEFRNSEAGSLSAMKGVQGAGELDAVLSKLLTTVGKEDRQMAAFLIKTGQGGQAQAMIGEKYGALAAQLTTQASGMSSNAERAGGDYGTALQAQLQSNKSAIAGMAGAHTGDGINLVGNRQNVSTAIGAQAFIKDLDNAANRKPDDKPTGTSEAENVKSMVQLTAALDSLRASVAGLTAVMVGILGTIGTVLVAGAAGGLAGKLGGIGGWAGGASKTAGKVADKAGGAFGKLGDAAGKGMGAFGDFLGKLGTSDALKGAGVLALLGGALALTSFGLKQFNEVEWPSVFKGMLALGGLIGISKILGSSSSAAMKAAGVLALLGGALALTSFGLKQFNEVEWPSVFKGMLALGGLIGISKILGSATTSILKGAAAIAALGIAVGVAGFGFKQFNEVHWEGVAKGVVGLLAFGAAAILIGALAGPILLGSLAIAALGIAVGVFGIGAGIAAWSVEKLHDALKSIGEISGSNLVLIGAGLAAIGSGMVVFAAGMIVGTGSSIITGILSLFGARSPLERIKEFVPIADKIAMIGKGIADFGKGIGDITAGLTGFDSNALTDFKDLMVEFSKAGSSDEMRLTAEYLTSIGTALEKISTVTPQMPSSLPKIDSASSGIGSQSPSAITASSLDDVIAYLSNIQGELQGIRSNTKLDSNAPVRLS